LKALVEKLSLSEKIKFYDSLPTASIVTYMADADLAIVPKRASSQFGNEAASTKIPELMALGIPIIASRTKIDSEYYTDSLVKFFASENVEDLANSILLLYRNPNLRSQLVESAVGYMQANDWDSKKQRYLTLVDGLVMRHFPRYSAAEMRADPN
jgi:glycosyltransferase involved in cell wall biosynthesis